MAEVKFPDEAHLDDGLEQGFAVVDPGSFEKFCQGFEPELTGPEAVDLYGKALHAYKTQLAAKRGISVEQLHAMEFPAADGE